MSNLEDIIKQLQEENHLLRDEIHRLIKLHGDTTSTILGDAKTDSASLTNVHTESNSSSGSSISSTLLDAHSSAAEKIDLFTSLFKGRPMYSLAGGLIPKQEDLAILLCVEIFGS